MTDFHDYFYKIVLIGDSAVGKSCLLSRFTYNEFNSESKSTIGVDFATKSVIIDDKVVKVQIWDTAGQERFRSISRVFYNGALAAMVTYDITNSSSFANITTWMNEVRKHTSEEIALMMVGNKMDLRHLRVVNTEEGAEFAKNNDMLFIETSALDSTNVEEAFHEIIRKVHRKMRVKKIVEEHAKEKETVHLDQADGAPNQANVKTNNCC
ncbi:uncharacterized protein [Clytia hemisphaerica]|uniref:Ras-related protein Rab-25 n=2 Tax=Clytia hemisphaerica TaxID=252671 RepID=A0A7M5XCG8_9CNID